MVNGNHLTILIFSVEDYFPTIFLTLPLWFTKTEQRTIIQASGNGKIRPLTK